VISLSILPSKQPAGADLFGREVDSVRVSDRMLLGSTSPSRVRVTTQLSGQCSRCPLPASQPSSSSQGPICQSRPPLSLCHWRHWLYKWDRSPNDAKVDQIVSFRSVHRLRHAFDFCVFRYFVFDRHFILQCDNRSSIISNR